MCENIAYDVKGYFSGKKEVEPEQTYRNGYSVCSGYSRLFKLMGTYIDLDIICVSGYAKGVSYKEGQKISGTNHEWNIIKLNNVYYQIDSTWGAGYLNGRKFEKKLKEYFFCPESEHLFSSHFPEEQKWQLIYPFLTVGEFSKRIYLKDIFYDLFKLEENLKYHTIKVKSKHTIRFNKIKENADIGVIITVLDGNGKETKNAQCIPLYDKNYIDFFYIFKRKGKYQTQIFADYNSASSK